MTEISIQCWKTFQQFINSKTFFRHSLYANASYIWASRLTRAGLTFVFWIIAARLYAKESVGLAGTIVSTILLIGNLSSLGLIQGIIRFLPNSKYPRDLINSSFIMITISSSIVAMLFLVGMNWWSPKIAGVFTGSLFVVIFIILAIAGILFEVLSSIFAALRIAYNTFWVSLIGAGLRVGLILVLPITSWGEVSLVTVYYGALAVAFFIGVITLLPQSLSNYHFGWWGASPRKITPMLRFSFANYLNSFLWTAPAQLFPLLVITTAGEKAAANFYIAWLLTNILTMISNSFGTSLFAEGSNSDHQFYENVKRTLKGGLLGTGLSAASLVILAYPILQIFGEEYTAEAVGLVRVLSLAGFIGIIPMTFMAIARVKEWMSSLIAIAIVRVILGLAIGAWLIEIYGLIGIGIAWVVAQVVTAILALILIFRKKFQLR